MTERQRRENEQLDEEYRRSKQYQLGDYDTVQHLLGDFL
jgi:hypothetical protein